MKSAQWMKWQPMLLVLGALARRRAQRQDRDAFMQLVWQEDRILSDCGYTRADINWAAQLPLHKNAALELRRQAQSDGPVAVADPAETVPHTGLAPEAENLANPNFEPLLCRG